MTKIDILVKISDHHAELAKLYRELSGIDAQSPTVRADARSEIPQCECGLQAEVFSGTSKKNGKPFTKYSCGKGYKAKDKCDFLEWGS